MSAYLVNKATGDVVVQLDPAASVTFEWAAGVTASLVRGVTDTDITAIALRSPNGSLKYLTIADNNTVSASATAP